MTMIKGWRSQLFHIIASLLSLLHCPKKVLYSDNSEVTRTSFFVSTFFVKVTPNKVQTLNPISSVKHSAEKTTG